MLRIGDEYFFNRDLRLGPCITAVWTSIASQMTIGDIVVSVFALAVDAVGCVGNFVDGVLIDGSVHSVEKNIVLESVGQRRRQRIVRVQTDNGIATTFESDADIVQCMGYFAIAIKLISEYIGHDNGLWIHGFTDFLEGSFVGFYDGIGESAFAGQRRIGGKLRRDPAHQIGAALIGQIRNSGIDVDLFDHSGGRCFAVGSGYDYSRNILGEVIEKLGVDEHCDSARKIGSASPQKSQGGSCKFGCGYRQKNSYLVHMLCVEKLSLFIRTLFIFEVRPKSRVRLRGRPSRIPCLPILPDMSLLPCRESGLRR